MTYFRSRIVRESDGVRNVVPWIDFAGPGASLVGCVLAGAISRGFGTSVPVAAILAGLCCLMAAYTFLLCIINRTVLVAKHDYLEYSAGPLPNPWSISKRWTHDEVTQLFQRKTVDINYGQRTEVAADVYLLLANKQEVKLLHRLPIEFAQKVEDAVEDFLEIEDHSVRVEDNIRNMTSGG